MSNFISYKDEDCSCSNGCMSVLLTVIGLSGSALAENDFEKNIIVWLAEKDQNIVGLGTVGFDITEMPWDRIYFEKQKNFMLKVLDGVINKLGWETLDYEPNTQIIFDKINQLKDMFMQIVSEDINYNSVDEWFEDESIDIFNSLKVGYPKCTKHGIYLSTFGCIACNDM